MYFIGLEKINNMWLPSVVEGVSKVSYSIYLWHYLVYSLLVFEVGNFVPITYVVYFLVSTFLGVLGFKLIEEPFEALRSKRKFKTTIFPIGLCVTGLCLVLAIGDFNKERSDRDMFVSAAKAERLDRIGSGVCHFNKLGRYTEIDTFLSAGSCIDKEAKILVFGDSHAADVASAIRSTARIKQFTGAGCSLLASSNGPNRSYCNAIYESALRHLKRNDTVILVNRWDENELNREYLESVIREWENRSVELVLVLPRANVSIPLLEFVFSGNPKDDADLSDTNKVLQLLGEVEVGSVKHVNANECFCEGANCKILDNEELLVTDADHYSSAGMKILGECLADRIDKLREENRS